MYPLSSTELERLTVLRGLKVLDTPAEKHFDAVCRTAQALFSVPIAVIALMDENRHWFKARSGTEINELPRDVAFCNHTISSDDVLVIEDTLVDARFSENA